MRRKRFREKACDGQMNEECVEVIKKKFRCPVSIKIAGFFIFMLWFTGILSGSIFQVGTEQRLLVEVKERMEAFSEQLQNFYAVGEITQENLPALLQGSFFTAEIFDTKEELENNEQISIFFTKEEIATIDRRGKIRSKYLENSLDMAKLPAEIAIVEYEGQKAYMFICPNVALDIFKFRGAGAKLMLCLLVVILIITVIGTRFIVKPIKRLAVASQKIAEGDFNVKVKYKGNDEMGDLVANFNNMAKELDNIEILRSSFISDISHVFRTPLTSIEGYTKLLEECADEEERKQYIDIIMRETGRLTKLSQSILLLNRLENQNLEIQKTQFSLDEQIRQVILLSEPAWNKKDIDFDIELENITYNGNMELLHQVWMNLLDNAVQYTPHGGKISMRLAMDDGKVLFRIHDGGKGLSEEAKKRVFEKFYKEDTARTNKGNGLGMSIVKRVAELHGGSVSAENGEQIGAVFTVRL